MDVRYLGLMMLFFVLSYGVVALCERVGGER